LETRSFKHKISFINQLNYSFIVALQNKNEIKTTMLRSPKDMVNLLQNNSKFKLNPYNQRFINRIVTNTILNMISLVDLVTKRPLTPTVMSFVMEEKKKNGLLF
jgi:hypothetical protein